MGERSKFRPVRAAVIPAKFRSNGQDWYRSYDQRGHYSVRRPPSLGKVRSGIQRVARGVDSDEISSVQVILKDALTLHI